MPVSASIRLAVTVLDGTRSAMTRDAGWPACARRNASPSGTAFVWRRPARAVWGGAARAAFGRRLRGDSLLPVAAGDLDAARLGGFADRDGQGEHARGVVGRDLVGVEGLAEEDLPGVGAVRSFGDQQLGAVGLGRGALGADGEHVLLNGQADRVRVDAGQVEVDVELVAVAVGVHRHRGRSGGGAEDLLGDPVQFAERVGAHEHGWASLPCRMCVTLTRFIYHRYQRSDKTRLRFSGAPYW